MERRAFIKTCSAGFAIAAAPSLTAMGETDAKSADTASTQQKRADWPMFRGNSLSQGLAKCALPERPALKWKYRIPDGAFESTPAIVGNIVYVGDLDGLIVALDLETGKEKWKERKAELGYVASPTIGKGRLYVGNIDGEFFCLDLQGKEQWKFNAEVEIASSANFYKDNVLFGTQAGELYCLSADKGKQVWKFEIQDQIRCSPTVVENRAFLAGCDGALHVVDLDKGKSVATVPIDSPTCSTPAVLGDHAFFGTEAGEFLCVDWRKHKVVWRFADPKRGQAFRSCAAVSEEIVVIGGRSKRVYALNPKNGEQLWRFVGKADYDSSPVIAGDRIFVASTRGRLTSLDVDKGKKKWEQEMGSGFAGSPAIAHERLVICSDDGVVYCFG